MIASTTITAKTSAIIKKEVVLVIEKGETLDLVAVAIIGTSTFV